MLDVSQVAEGLLHSKPLDGNWARLWSQYDKMSPLPPLPPTLPILPHFQARDVELNNDLQVCVFHLHTDHVRPLHVVEGMLSWHDFLSCQVDTNGSQYTQRIIQSYKPSKFSNFFPSF
jgi:hypothetical protein